MSIESAYSNLYQEIESETIDEINRQIKQYGLIHYDKGVLYCITTDFTDDVDTTLEQMTYDVLSMHNYRGTGKLWSNHIPEMTAFRDDLQKCVDILNKAIEGAVDDL